MLQMLKKSSSSSDSDSDPQPTSKRARRTQTKRQNSTPNICSLAEPPSSVAGGGSRMFGKKSLSLSNVYSSRVDMGFAVFKAPTMSEYKQLIAEDVG